MVSVPVWETGGRGFESRLPEKASVVGPIITTAAKVINQPPRHRGVGHWMTRSVRNRDEAGSIPVAAINSEEKRVQNYFPGTRVRVFDTRLYKDDVSTPPSTTMRAATVKRWYGYRSQHHGVYENQIDIEFDHRPGEVSRGHFANGVEVLEA